MITAMQARALSGPSPQEQVDLLEPLIRQAAKEKKRSIKLTDTFWTNGAYGNTDDFQEAYSILTKLGYKVSFFYEERQFVDMYTTVEW